MIRRHYHEEWYTGTKRRQNTRLRPRTEGKQKTNSDSLSTSLLQTLERCLSVSLLTDPDVEPRRLWIKSHMKCRSWKILSPVKIHYP